MANCVSESLRLYSTLDLFGGKDSNDKILGKDLRMVPVEGVCKLFFVAF